MAKYVKNNDSIARTWCGMEIQPQDYYLLQAVEEAKWANNSNVLQSIIDETLIVSKTNNNSGHILDYSDAVNYLKGNILDVDDQGRQINRIAAAQAGWTYLGDNIQIETSKLNSLECKDYLGNTVSGVTLKFYDSNNNELTTQQDLDTLCVKTELTVAPPYDYEIMGGTLRQISRPSTKIRLWTVGGIIQLGSGYTKEMVRNTDLRFLSPDDHIKTDGRATKYMKKDVVGVPYQANQLKFILKHDAGVKHELQINVEYFRA